MPALVQKKSKINMVISKPKKMKNWKKKKRVANSTKSKTRLRPLEAIIHQKLCLKMMRVRAIYRAACAIFKQMIATSTMIFFLSEATQASYRHQATIKTMTLSRNQSTLKAKLRRSARGLSHGMNKLPSAPIKCKMKQKIVLNQYPYPNQTQK